MRVINRLLRSDRGRYTTLLVAILLVILVSPHLQPGLGFDLLLSLGFGFILIAAVFAISGNRVYLWVCWILLAAAASGNVLLLISPGPLFAMVRVIPSAMFFLLVSMAFLRHILEAEEINVDRILGAVCVYLLLGIGWTVVFSTLELLHPGSFRIPGEIPILVAERQEMLFGVFIYYSFVTMSTLGYGDIAPITPAARTFSILEAIMGQMYLAVIVATLVGIHIGQRARKRGP